MTALRRLLAFILVLVLIPAAPVRAAETGTDELIRQLINYYRYYQAEARTDCLLLLDELQEQDPALAESWKGIMDFWTHLNRDMQVHEPILPDGLPDDDSLCIVVMGFYLHSDGSIRKELEDRLNVALKSAEKYPNAYILCTGGGTASENRKATEAGQMARWLSKHGIREDRIITETKASSTIENAVFGCELLYREYPQVRSLAVITSDYHVRRSCLYFHTQSALDAYNANCAPMQVVAGASCTIRGESPTDIETQAEGMSILTGLDTDHMSQPQLSQLERIEVGGTTRYRPGEPLDLTVSAVYSSGRSREVTEGITYSGLDLEKTGIQTLTVTYREGDAVQTATIGIELLPAPTEAVPTLPCPTEPTVEAMDPSNEVPQESPADSDLLLPVGGGCIVLLAVLLSLKSGQTSKHRRRSNANNEPD